MELWIWSPWHVAIGLRPGTILAGFGKSIVVFFDPFGSLLHYVLSWVPSFEGRFGNLELLIELLL